MTLKSFHGVNAPAEIASVGSMTSLGGVNDPAKISHEIFKLFHNFLIS
jgi:hypothetical protein